MSRGARVLGGQRPLHQKSNLLWALLLAAPLGLGCPERVQGNGAVPAACAEVGQRCEVSPGKLGSCVLIDECRQGDCYVCQSQH